MISFQLRRPPSAFPSAWGQTGHCILAKFTSQLKTKALMSSYHEARSSSQNEVLCFPCFCTLRFASHNMWFVSNTSWHELSQIRISGFYFLILKPNIDSQPLSPIILGQNTACITTGLIPPRLYPNLMLVSPSMSLLPPLGSWACLTVTTCHWMMNSPNTAAGADNTQTCALHCAGSDCWLLAW